LYVSVFESQQAKANQLSAKLGIPVTADQVILSHTPLRRLTAQYADKSILVIGGDSCMQVARSYGFKQPICPSEVLK
jgi:ribonucleotide monophosphatase NagD (HAD superfamily)